MPGRASIRACRGYRAGTAPRCGGPAANSQTGGPSAGSASSDEQTVPKPPRGTTLICSPGSPERSARMACQAAQSSGLGRLGRLEARQVAGDPRAVRIVRVVRGDHVQAGCQRQRLRMPVAEAADENRPCRSASTRLKLRQAPASRAAMAAAASRGRRVIQRQQRQLAAAALAGGRAQAAGPVQHRRDDAMPVHPHPGAAARAVAAGNHVRLIGPVRGRRVPGAVQQLVAVGGEQQRPGVAGADQQDDGAHWLRDLEAPRRPAKQAFHTSGKRRREPDPAAVPRCPATAARTMTPPTKLVTEGVSAKDSHTQAMASGVSSVLSSAFSVADTIWPPTVSSTRPSPNCVVPNRNRSACSPCRD